MRYSNATKCFYPEHVQYQGLPADIVVVSDNDFNAAISKPPGASLDLIDGRVVVVPEPDADVLLREKGRAAEAIKVQAGQAEHAPVRVGQYTMRGGQGSAVDLKGQLDLAMAIALRMPELNITTVKFYDVNGDEVVVPIESDTEVDAWDIVIAVALQVSTTRFKQIGLELAIARANSKAELDQIKWSE